MTLNVENIEVLDNIKYIEDFQDIETGKKTNLINFTSSSSLHLSTEKNTHVVFIVKPSSFKIFVFNFDFEDLEDIEDHEDLDKLENLKKS